MKFNTAYGYYYPSSVVLGEGACLYLSHCKRYGLEIGTGLLMDVKGKKLWHENTTEQVSRIQATVIVNGMNITETMSPLAKVKAHRLLHLNPLAKVELLYLGGQRTRVLFPYNDEFLERFVNGGERLQDVSRKELNVPLSMLLRKDI